MPKTARKKVRKVTRQTSKKTTARKTRAVSRRKELPPNNNPTKVLSTVHNSALQLPGRPSMPLVQPAPKKGKRKYTFKSEETRQRCLSKLTPIQKGQVLNPGGRPKTKPFHNAARLLAESNWQDLQIKPDDTVAEAIMKIMAARAMSHSQQAVPAAKELADRAEGAPVQVHEHEGDGGGLASRGLEEILVRFGVQLAVRTSADAQ